MAAKTIEPVKAPVVTDWSGRLLSKEARQLVQPGCIVRACVTNNEGKGTEALYFRVIKVKDGTVWGETQDTYRIDDSIGLPNGKVFSFRLDDISEIPLDWQPNRVRKALKKLVCPENKARPVTGIFL